MNNIGLVLEGGGMRGVYTGGVLDFFMDKNLYFPYVIGVSMGACSGASYVSKQRGRTKSATIDYVSDPRYLSYRNLLKYKSIFGMDFVFNEIPTKLLPFDFDTFFNYYGEFVIGATNCNTGKEVYFYKKDYNYENILKVIQASSSLPFVAEPVKINDYILMDGGLSDPVPIKKSIADGNKKNIIILTRNSGYMKKPFKFKWVTSKKYSKFKGLCDSIINRPVLYNNTMEYIDELEKSGDVFIIRPDFPPDVKRTEKNTEKLTALYLQGYKDAEKNYDKLLKFIDEN
ncbi:patatin-like phospholipase family protein [Clostridium hydrogenum]|uniref:patatin-like phospholipase family protein n=1 Tax=Clostridium hydrogenum TaxID=2855764 RepID=UPI001F3650A5|nr:patatin family protein [Clostridium hydrogenum]